MTEKQRTTRQNRALHALFQMYAETLNEAGYDMRATLKPEVEIPWDAGTIKNYLWRPIQKIQLGKESTTELSTKEIDLVFETLNRHLGDKLGIHCSFPSIEQMLLDKDVEHHNF